MDDLERMFDAYLEEVNRLSKEYELDKDVCLKFKGEILEILYDAAMTRKENAWAEYFKNKY